MGSESEHLYLWADEIHWIHQEIVYRDSPMSYERLFVLQVVIAIEEQWFTPGTNGPPIRTERRYVIDDSLFAALDEEAAFLVATDWIKNDAFSDSNHDGSGDLTRIFALGIHQLEEVGRISELPEEVHQLYGLSLPGFTLSDLDGNGVPIVRQRAELEVFRRQRLCG